VLLVLSPWLRRWMHEEAETHHEPGEG
jgi:hypothetical protein